jgi:hypothetical protein
MTDALLERFAALAENGDGDWSDVRRRARGAGLRVAVPAAVAAAAIAAAAALAATGGWVFSTHDRQVTARTDIVLAGRTWRVSYSASTRARAVFCLRASSPGTATRSSCTEMGPGSPRLAPPLGAMKLTVPGGQIWVGATVGFTRRVAITDAAGRVHKAQAVRPPKGTKTPFRYWVIALASAARSITSYGPNGRMIVTKLP